MRVKVLKLGHSTRESEVPAGSNVQNVLDKVDFDPAGYSVTINGLGASLSAAVSDGDIVTLVPKVEGGRL
ncbi:MAG: MoaD/ThiS family protein [Deltaproteobacteria bacterium]|nr:MoaD/ThiS family protein [Deltaproteobacteria bacterium]